MDLQNVKNITIPEGSVNNIHDQIGKLLWGRLAYDTTYAGDTFQQTYSGKNLLPPPTNGTRTSGGIEFTVTNSTITGTGTVSAVPPSIFNTVDLPSILPSGTYTFSIPESNTYRIGIILVDGNGTTHSDDTLSIPAGDTSVTITTTYAIAKYRLSLRGVSVGQSVNFSMKNEFQLETGSTPTTIEPYVGSVPAPNPDYPQDIDVVTGTQTVQITAGTESEDFTVDLGTIELGEIGSYQDYIYKSGDDWYVHKATGSITMDVSIQAITDATGSSSSTVASYAGAFMVRKDNWDAAGGDYDNTIANALVSSNLGVYESQSIPSNGNANIMIDGTFCQRSGNNDRIYFRNSGLTGKTGNEVKSLLAANSGGSNFYYALATPTETKITDTTLITQLNAIHKWLTRHGYLSNVTGNLPLLIKQTNL